MEPASGLAHARAALAGNPSDGYGGAVLAVTLADWSAQAQATRGEGVSPANELVEAAVRRFGRGGAVRWTTTIPIEVGLGGSSALVIATLRALCELHEVALAPDRLAALALAIEVDDLGIAAGPQDRLAQAFGGVTFMDFAGNRTERLDVRLLPPLAIAYREDAGAASGGVHAGLRERFDRGEAGLAAAMRELARLARSARDALVGGDQETFGACVAASYDARARLVELDPRCAAMIATAREAGACANYAGSGGAIVAACRDLAHREAVIAALRATGATAGAVRPV
jgi:glucuronokinase